MEANNGIHTWLKSIQRTSNDYELLQKKLSTLPVTKENRKELVEQAKEREESNRMTWKRIQEIRRMFLSLQPVLRDVNKNNLDWSDESLSFLEIFEERLSTFKVEMRKDFDSLIVAEKGLVKEIATINEEIDNYDDHVNNEVNRAESTTKDKPFERRDRDIERRALIGKLDKKVLMQRK